MSSRFFPYMAALILAGLLVMSFIFPHLTPLFTLAALTTTGLTTKKIIGLHGRPHLLHRLALPMTLTLSSFLLILPLEYLAGRIIAISLMTSILFRLLQRLREEGLLPLPQAARDTATPTLAFLLTIFAVGTGSRALVTFLDLPLVFSVLIFTTLISCAAWSAFHLHLPGGVIPRASFAVFTLITLELSALVAFFPWSPLSSGVVLVASIGYVFLMLSDALAGQLDSPRVFLYGSASMVTLLSVLGSARWLA